MRVPTRAFNRLKHDLRRQAGTLKGVAARGKVETATRATQEGVLDARCVLGGWMDVWLMGQRGGSHGVCLSVDG